MLLPINQVKEVVNLSVTNIKGKIFCTCWVPVFPSAWSSVEAIDVGAQYVCTCCQAGAGEGGRGLGQLLRDSAPPALRGGRPELGHH